MRWPWCSFIISLSSISSLDLLHTLTISESGTGIAGDPFNLTCTVDVSRRPVVQWIHSNGTNVTSVGGISVGLPMRAGNITNLTLTFDPLLTSHGGPYTCQSVVDEASSTRNSTRNITVQCELVDLVHALHVSTISPCMGMLDGLVPQPVSTVIMINHFDVYNKADQGLCEGRPAFGSAGMLANTTRILTSHELNSGQPTITRYQD